MPERPIAYFITFRTYGTWLSGDARGSVDDQHNAHGEPFAPRDDFRRGYQERQLKTEPVTLSAASRNTVEAAIEEVCRHRAWELLALNVRSNHIHAVIVSVAEPERVLGDMKSYATRALRRRRLTGPGQPVWARHGSTVYLWSEEEVERCVAYVHDFQGGDLPGSDWIREFRQGP